MNSESLQPKERLSDTTPLSEVEPIEECSYEAATKERLADLVEAPLLEACEVLYEKGIRTIMSAASKKDLQNGEVYIDIEFDSLSEENKQIALSLGNQFKMHGSMPMICIKLKFPINTESTVGEIRKAASEVVNQFNNQS
jgi:hypothetical protein